MSKATLWRPMFRDFITHMRIDSKEVAATDERGTELNMWGSQEIALHEICTGLDDDVRTFIILKARQLGITTISLAIDLFWLLIHPGLLGALVTDTEGNRNVFRATLDRYLKNLPPKLVGDNFEITKHNRDFLLLPNGSRLDYIVAGTRSKTNWGEGRGYVLAHLTEVAAYGNPEGLASFRETLAETHPNRLFIYESTAKGFNHWKDMWDESLRDKFSKRGIFIGWWAKEINRIARKDKRFATYGSSAPDPEEKELIRAVKDRYGINIDQEQLAWYRWRESDTSRSAQDTNQNLPWIAEQAFVFTGYSFFQSRLIARDMAEVDDPANEDEYSFKAYRYWIDNDFFAIKMEQIVDAARISEVELRVWEEPKKEGQYVIGCDPAHGRSDWKDNCGISVWRCFGDKLVQVAEFASSNFEAHQAAWILAHLAGGYKDCIVNIELTGGPGRAIMVEFERLRNMMRTEMTQPKGSGIEWDDVLSNARWYLYHRPDSMGAGYAYNFMTTRDSKFHLMNDMRSSYSQRLLHLRSRPMLEEMHNVIQDGGSIEAQGRNKDDRVFAAALANMAWLQWVKPMMMSNGLSYRNVIDKENGETTAGRAIVEKIVWNYFRRAEEEDALNPPRTDEERMLRDRGLI
jgi:hypothetical protein